MKPWLPALLAALTGCQPADPPPAAVVPVAMPEASVDGVHLRVLRSEPTAAGWQVELSLQNDHPWDASGLGSVRRGAVFHPGELSLVDANGVRWPATGDDVVLRGRDRNRQRRTVVFEADATPTGLVWDDVSLPWPGQATFSEAEDPLQRAADELSTPEQAAALVRDQVGVIPAWGIRHSPAAVWRLGRGTPVERAELLRAFLGDLGFTSRLACGEHREPAIAAPIASMPMPHTEPPAHAAYALAPAWCWAQVQQGEQWIDLDLRSDTSAPLPFLWETTRTADAHLWRFDMELVALHRAGPEQWESTSLWQQSFTSAALSERTLVLDLQPMNDITLNPMARLVGSHDAHGRQGRQVPLQDLERVVLKLRWTDPGDVLSSEEERTIWESSEAMGPQAPIRLGLTSSPGIKPLAPGAHAHPDLLALKGRMASQLARAHDADVSDPADPTLTIWQGTIVDGHLHETWMQPRPPLAATADGRRPDLGLHLAWHEALGGAVELPQSFTAVPDTLVGADGIDQLHRNEMMRGLGRGRRYAITEARDLWELDASRGTWSRWRHVPEVVQLPTLDTSPTHISDLSAMWTQIEQARTQARRVANKAPADVNP